MILEFLESFYDSDVALFDAYYPTSSLIFHHFLEIAMDLNTYENENFIKTYCSHNEN